MRYFDSLKYMVRRRELASLEWLLRMSVESLFSSRWTWWKATDWKRPWCWGRLRAGGEWGAGRWLVSIIDTMGVSLSKLWQVVKNREARSAAVHGVAESDATEQHDVLRKESFILVGDLIFTMSCLEYSYQQRFPLLPSLNLLSHKSEWWDVPGGPVVTTPHSQCKGPRFCPWWELDPTCHD